MRISLGPIQHYWPADKIRDFYHQITACPVDIVYLGEVVCSKRQELALLDWLYIADMLADAGKEVVLSTLVQVDNETDLKTLLDISENGDYKVEANTDSAIRLAYGRPFVAGPSLDNNHENFLQDLKYHGAVRWVMPVDFSESRLNKLNESRPDTMQIEVFVYGGLPLSFSSNCFTAQAHHLTNEHCNFVCKKYYEGMEMSSHDSQDTLIVNGFQIQPGMPCNLIQEINYLKSAGIDVVRISPQLNNMQSVIETFAQAVNGVEIDQDFIESAKWCNEYWYGEVDIERCIV